MTSVPSLAILAAIGYYLLYRRTATKSIWLFLNLLDTFRALRQVRPNGRGVGLRTRQRAMRESLTSWIVFVGMMTAGPWVEKLISWLPLYRPIKAIVVIGFLFTRSSSSLSIYRTFVDPLLRQYETPIDLTLLLLHSSVLLINHYLLLAPYDLLRTLIASPQKIIQSLIGTLFSSAEPDIAELHQPPDVDPYPQPPASPVISATNTFKSTVRRTTPKGSRPPKPPPSVPVRYPALPKPPSIILPALPFPPTTAPVDKTPGPATPPPKQATHLAIPTAPPTVRRSSRRAISAGEIASQTDDVPREPVQPKPKSRMGPAVRSSNVPRSATVSTLKAEAPRPRQTQQNVVDTAPKAMPAPRVRKAASSMTLGGSIVKHSSSYATRPTSVGTNPTDRRAPNKAMPKSTSSLLSARAEQSRVPPAGTTQPMRSGQVSGNAGNAAARSKSVRDLARRTAPEETKSVGEKRRAVVDGVQREVKRKKTAAVE